MSDFAAEMHPLVLAQIKSTVHADHPHREVLWVPTRRGWGLLNGSFANTDIGVHVGTGEGLTVIGNRGPQREIGARRTH